MTCEKLLTNIYFAAKHHKELNLLLKNDLMAEDWMRQKALGSYDAYAYIEQMVVHSDTIGCADYKKVFKMDGNLPTIY